MKILNSLSIRDRFLIAPLLGICLTLILYFAANASIESKVELLEQIQGSNLPQVSELSITSIEMLKAHAALTQLLLESIETPDEEAFYLGGREIINQLYTIENKLKQQLAHPVFINNIELTGQVQQVFSHYKKVVIGSIELATIDALEAQTQLLEANRLLDQSYDLLKTLFRYYVEHLSEKSTQIDQSLRDRGVVGVLTLTLLAVMFFSAQYFARRMSDTQETMNLAMVNLAKGDLDTPLPHLEDRYLKDFCDAVKLFRDSLRKNATQTEHLTRALKQIKQNEKHYFHLLNLTAAAIVIIDEQQQVTLINEAAQRLFKKSFQEVLERNVFELVHSSSLLNPQILQHFLDEDSDRILSIDSEPQLGRCASGNIFYFHAALARYASKGRQMLTISIQDITEQLRSEQKLLEYQNQLETLVQHRTQELQDSVDQLTQAQGQLIESEKMASLGGLVAGIAHEINTPVGIGITASSQLKEMNEAFSAQFKDGTLSAKALERFIVKVAECADINLLNLKRAAQLISSFKEISVDQSTEELRPFNLQHYCNDILTSMRPKFKHTEHEIKFECPDDIDMLSIPGALSQVVTNFLMNSLIHGFDAIECGKIQIDVSVQGEKVHLCYRDNGKGIKQAHLQNVFEPFYTTKRSSGSTGLGMHIVYNLITQSLRGAISCHSKEGQGVTFKVTFPRDLSRYQEREKKGRAVGASAALDQENPKGDEGKARNTSDVD
ncbi:MAG: ATP-binding protein [Pseudomonadales bacterium]